MNFSTDSLVLAMAGLVVMVGLAASASKPIYRASLVLLAPTVPIVASFAAIALYGLSADPWQTALGGLVFAIASWLILAMLCRDLPSAQRCNESSYAEIRQRLRQLDTQLDELGQRELVVPEAREQRAMITALLEGKTSTLSWVTATGYITVWKHLHRAEEALIEVLPKETVVAQALKDELRLLDSKIGSQADLRFKLHRAATVLEPEARAMFKLSAEEATLLNTRAEHDPRSITGAVTAPSAAPADSAGAEPRPDEQTEQVCVVLQTSTTAGRFSLGRVQTSTKSMPHQGRDALSRAVLRMIRRTINEYVDDTYESLVTSRNRTWGTAMMVGLTLCALLMIAIAANALTPKPYEGLTRIGTGALLFLGGALAGLLGRLRAEAKDAKDIPDYGLSNARLFCTPLYSGLAGLAGVVLVFGAKISSAGALFTFEDFFEHLVCAAAFGLTPEVLFNKLQEQSEQYKTNLRSSEATQTK